MQDTLDGLSLTQQDLALRTSLNPKTVNQIIKGKSAITPETAMKLERVLGTPASFWINLESNYRGALARKDMRKKLRKEITIANKFTCFSEMVKLGWVSEAKSALDKVKKLLDFFGVDSLSLVMESQSIAYRKSNCTGISKESLAAWLRRGELEARDIEAEAFNEKRLKKNISKLRLLTKNSPKRYGKAVREICFQSGVVVTYVPYLKNTYVQGAARWLTPTKALIHLSLRYKYADIFWFTLFHELGHILMHSKKGLYIDFENNGSYSSYEIEADRFAANKLIPKPSYIHFVKASDFSTESIKKFADQMGLDAGIIAGRLAHDSYVKWKDVAQLRQRLKFTSS